MELLDAFREIRGNAAWDAGKELFKLMGSTLAASVALWLNGHSAVVWASALLMAVLLMFLDSRRPKPRLEIESAKWVCTTNPTAFRPVKDVLERSSDGHLLRIRASDKNFGDPCEDHGGKGHAKRLEVNFARRGK